MNSKSIWHDPYVFIANSWIEKNKNDPSVEYMTRKNIKKPTMTALYGASYTTCWDYFIEKIDTGAKSKEDIAFLKKSFKNYYTFINNNLGILAKSSKEIIAKLENVNYNVITSQNIFEIDLKYYKISKKQIKYQNLGVRYTKNQQILTSELDIKKTKTALRANYVHIHDASVVHYILKIKPTLTIHDCFMVDYISITYLVSLVNEAMRTKFHDLGLNEQVTKEIFSPFIVI
jgi:hypothetical protein